MKVVLSNILAVLDKTGRGLGNCFRVFANFARGLAGLGAILGKTLVVLDRIGGVLANFWAILPIVITTGPQR